MVDFTLKAVSPLGGYTKTFDGASLREVVNLAIVSIALPLGREDAAEKAILSAFGIAAPAVGVSVTDEKQTKRLIRLGTDQLFALVDRSEPGSEAQIADKLKIAAYTTDQTDVWVGLEISGARARDVLERICPLDLHPNAFAINGAARTSMEHLGTIIIRTGDHTYLLLSASSSAGSFLHAVETSITNVV